MYTISYPSGTIRKDGAVIEQQDDLAEFQQYVAWLNLGNGPTVEVEPVTPVAVCTPWQFRKKINALGLREAVEAYVAAQDQETRDGFEYATEWLSDDPLLLKAIPHLGITPEQLYVIISDARNL